ncbi:uncharacterized protein LOC133202140 [Saccostrea echinata]|uniref:uncharacterized protein LOC133202140 n=1 Tax=Saccostrea echinata TaxID=191078 RepID=UPI002A7F32A8|nr:uncharacterized protein LOC133202140 [Saccostrea echinata]
MWIIYMIGVFILDPPNVACDEEPEGQSLLQEILNDLRNEQNVDSSSTSTTQDPPQTPSTTRTSNATFTFNTPSSTSPSQIFHNLTVSMTTQRTGGNDSNDDAIQSLISFLNNSDRSQTNDTGASLQGQIQDIFSKTPGNSTPNINTLSTTTLKSTDVTQNCAARDILQSLCTDDLPSLVKIANIWDVYYVLFSDDVMNELLLNCASGEWCIRDEFDIFRAKMAEKADMVMNSAMFSEACGQVSLECLQSAVQHLESCSFGPRLSFMLESVRLMCSVRDVTSSSDIQCTSQILAALHVTLMDILRKENNKQDLNTAFENDKCRTTEALMTRTYLCTCSKCIDTVNGMLSSFRPWLWFIDDVDTLKVTCHYENNTCVSRDMVFMIDDEPLPIPTPPTAQTDTYESQGSGFVDIRSAPVALAGFGTGAFVMVVGLIVFVIVFIKRHRVTSRKHEYKPLETNEP